MVDLPEVAGDPAADVAAVLAAAKKAQLDVLTADPALAATLLGWRATRSDLDTIVATALAWHRRHPPAPR